MTGMRSWYFAVVGVASVVTIEKAGDVGYTVRIPHVIDTGKSEGPAFGLK
jgi:hypothetical protein